MKDYFINNIYSPLKSAITSEEVDKPQEVEIVDKPQEAENVDKPQEAEIVDKPQEAENVDKPQEIEIVDKPQEAEKDHDKSEESLEQLYIQLQTFLSKLALLYFLLDLFISSLLSYLKFIFMVISVLVTLIMCSWFFSFIIQLREQDKKQRAFEDQMKCIQQAVFCYHLSDPPSSILRTKWILQKLQTSF